MVCRGKCEDKRNIKKYNIVKSVSQKYRIKERTDFKMPDNWHWCAICRRFYQGPDFCFCCGFKTRKSSRFRKTHEHQKEYRNSLVEYKLKFKTHCPHGMKEDILKNKTKWEELLAIKRPRINPLDYQ